MFFSDRIVTIGARATSYRQNDSVDVVYEAGGRRIVATALPLRIET